MKLLFVGSVFHQHIYNFSKELKLLDQEIYAFDLSGSSSKTPEVDPFIKIWQRPKGIGVKLVDFFIKSFGTFYKFYKINDGIDVVQFHYLDKYYTLPLAILSKFKGYKVSCFVYGSDFLRSGKLMKKLLHIIFDLSDSIVCDSVVLHKKLKEFSPHNLEKFEIINFGSIVIDDLEVMRKEKEDFLFGKDCRLNIMCGYNGYSAQNHLKIFDALLPYKDKIRLVIPMTYGKDLNYITKVKHFLDSNHFLYELLTDFIPDKQWENILIETDVFIHMQDSDSFSSALAEHLFLGHVVINAEWLKYDELDTNRIYFIKATFENLTSRFDNLLDNYEDEKNKHSVNAQKIYKMKSLSYCCGKYWVPYFRKMGVSQKNNSNR